MIGSGVTRSAKAPSDRITAISNGWPLLRVIRSAISSQVSTGTPSMAVMRSPFLNPASAAGDPSLTEPTEGLRINMPVARAMTKKNQHGQQDVEERPGEDNQNALQDAFVGEGERQELRVQLLVRLLSHHLHVSS